MNPQSRKAALFVLSSIFCGLEPVRAGNANAGADAEWSHVEVILSRIQPPKFPAREFPISQFGAVPDGKTDCTRAIRNAIETCHKGGGGRVLVPAGEFFTGPIHL